jgi:hypothetical protein
MNTTSTDDDITRRAKKRVDQKMGFYVHLLVYVLVNSGLFFLAQFRGDGHWNLFPLAGWGLGLAIHGIVTFLSLNGEGVRERMLADEVERLKGRR